MKNEKKVTLANFNCTYGKKDEPMLTYFENLILPSFNGDFTRYVSNQDKYFFDKVKLIEYKPDEYVLTGILIRSTILEVKSRYYNDAGLVNVNNKINTDPYSIFAIYLKNHRMILLQNQKGSPDIRSFRATIKSTMNQVRKIFNDNNNNKIPYVNLNITTIPSKYEIKKQLKNMKSIKKLSLKFYPLNGDVDTSETISSLRNQLNNLGSKIGSLDFRSPKNIDNVGDFIENTKGTSETTILATFKDGSSRRIVNDKFSENIIITIDDSSQYPENILNTITELDYKEELNECSQENRNIYLRFLNTIRNLANNV